MCIEGLIGWSWSGGVEKACDDFYLWMFVARRSLKGRWICESKCWWDLGVGFFESFWEGLGEYVDGGGMDRMRVAIW